MVTIEVKQVRLLGGSMSFLWKLYDPSSGQWVEIDPRFGSITNQSAGSLGLELESIAGAMGEWCEKDRNHFSGENWKKIVAKFGY